MLDLLGSITLNRSHKNTNQSTSNELGETRNSTSAANDFYTTLSFVQLGLIGSSYRGALNHRTVRLYNSADFLHANQRTTIPAQWKLYTRTCIWMTSSVTSPWNMKATAEARQCWSCSLHTFDPRKLVYKSCFPSDCQILSTTLETVESVWPTAPFSFTSCKFSGETFHPLLLASFCWRSDGVLSSQPSCNTLLALRGGITFSHVADVPARHCSRFWLPSKHPVDTSTRITFTNLGFFRHPIGTPTGYNILLSCRRSSGTFHPFVASFLPRCWHFEGVFGSLD